MAKIRKASSKLLAHEPASGSPSVSLNMEHTVNSVMLTNASNKKKIKKQKLHAAQEASNDEPSVDIDQWKNAPPLTDGNIPDDEVNVCNGDSGTKAGIKKKRKKQKVLTKRQEAIIDEPSVDIGQCKNIPAGNIPNDEANVRNGDLDTKAGIKKKRKKQRVFAEWQEVIIDEPSVDIDQRKNAPTPTDGNTPDDETNVYNGDLDTKAGIKKKRKKQKMIAERQEVIIDEPSYTNETDIPMDEANVCNGEDLITKAGSKKNIKKRKSRKEEQEETVEENSFSIEQHKNPHECEEHWALRNEFLEKNKHILPPEELVCLAQVYMNMKLYGCTYAPETMQKVNKLSEGLGIDYHRLRAYMLKRTLVSASDAAVSKVQKLNPMDLTVKNANTSGSTIAQSAEGAIPSHVLNRLRSDLIIFNDAFEKTLLEFNSLNKNMMIRLETYENKSGMVEGFVKIGDIVLAKSCCSNLKLAKRKVSENAMKLFAQYCYSIQRKKQAHKLSDAEVVERTMVDEVDDEPKIEKLDSDNVGFQLLAKLGWKGGSLGIRGDGIVEPVSVDAKKGRKGLGMENSANGAKPLKLNRTMIREMLNDFQSGKITDHHIVFSSEYSKEDRKFIHNMANRLNLRSQSHGKEVTGRQLVVSRKESMRPSEVLKKLVVEMDPTFCEMFEVTLPGELL